MHVDVRGVRYHMERTGQGSPLLLLHGFTGSTAAWEPFLAAFGQVRTVITCDFLGHGTSDRPDDAARYAMPETVADLAALLEALEMPCADLLGYSMGGRVALQFAHAHPERVRRLILESATPGIREANERAVRAASDEALAQTIERDGVEPFVAYWMGIPLFASQARLPAETRAHLRAQRLDNHPQGLANSLRAASVGKQKSLWDSLGNLNMPTLLLAGELDTRFKAIGRDLQLLMPRAQLEIVPGAGHTIHVEQPEAFEKLVLAFLHQEIGA